ncbi:hypothetical protein LCGC14_1238670 [marine sediment metagenome]|uniref:Uncharacterized protein n=1 Tax=marine sediment metagenome TaxID=412755 RepID=A0A0F9PAN7_9ZZZZ
MSYEESVSLLAHLTNISRILHPNKLFFKKPADLVIKELLKSPKHPFLAPPVNLVHKKDKTHEEVQFVRN